MNQRFLIHHTIIIHIKKKGNDANGAQITHGFSSPSRKSFRISTIARAFHDAPHAFARIRTPIGRMHRRLAPCAFPASHEYESHS